MADWYFYDANGYKIGPIKGRELKQSAQQGLITPETVVEDETGRTALAKQVTGLTFGETAQPKAVPPVSENPSTIAAPLPPAQPIPVPLPTANSKVDRANLAAKGKETISKGMNEVMGGHSAVKAATQARLKLNALNAQLVTAFRALGDAATQAGWGGELCEAISKQKEEVALATAQCNKTATDAELAKNTPGAGAAKQALSEAKTRMTLAAGILDGLREKVGRTLLSDTSAPSHIGVEQRTEIARLLGEFAECESIIAQGKKSLVSKPILVAAACILVAVIGIYFVSGFLSDSPSTVVKKFHVAIEKGDMRTLKKVAPSFGENLSDIEFNRTITDFAEFMVQRGLTRSNIGSISHTITGNSATVTINYSNGTSDEYPLVKIDGRWKIDRR